MKRNQDDVPGMFVHLDSVKAIIQAIERSLIFPTTWPELCKTIRDEAMRISKDTNNPYRKRLALRIRQYLIAAEEMVASKNVNVPYAVFMLGVQFSRLQLLEVDTEVKKAQRGSKRQAHATKVHSQNTQKERAELFRRLKPIYLRIAMGRSHAAICADLAKHCPRSVRYLNALMQPLNQKKIKK